MSEPAAIVVADTHGQRALVEALLDQLEADGLLDDRRLVFLGNYLDRGPIAALDRVDVGRLGGAPLVLVNDWYRVIGVAVGPATPPNRLEMLWGVSTLDGGSVVEIPSPNEATQPGWRVFALQPAAAKASKRQTRGQKGLQS